MRVLKLLDIWVVMGGLTLTLGRESLARNNDLRMHQSAPLVPHQLSCTAFKFRSQRMLNQHYLRYKALPFIACIANMFC